MTTVEPPTTTVPQPKWGHTADPTVSWIALNLNRQVQDIGVQLNQVIDDVGPSDWVYPPLQSPWQNVDTIVGGSIDLPQTRYRINHAIKRVDIEFAVGGGGPESHIFQLPDGVVIPSKMQTFVCGLIPSDSGGFGISGIYIDPGDGWVTYSQGLLLSAEDGVVVPDPGDFFVIANFSFVFG